MAMNNGFTFIIEVQGTRQSEFGERMFVYNYRIFDHYHRPVASMAVLADEHPDWKPASYGFSVLGCRHTLEFPVAKLTDYHDSLDELLTADNPFALITAAHILTQRTRKNDQERYEAKRRLVRLLYTSVTGTNNASSICSRFWIGWCGYRKDLSNNCGMKLLI